MNDEKIEIAAQKSRKTKRIIIAVFVGCLVLLVICALIPSNTGGGSESETYPPVDPSKLWDTKEEDFDIMEYDGYLKYDRTVYLDDRMTGVRVSIDETEAMYHGEGVKLMYALISAVIAGDSEAYNGMVSEDVGHFESFTQQQLYDIVITKHSQSQKTEESGTYTEIVLMLEYKIHENNGTFRNDIEPDASRPQYFVINDSEGAYKVMDIVNVAFAD